MAVGAVEQGVEGRRSRLNKKQQHPNPSFQGLSPPLFSGCFYGKMKIGKKNHVCSTTCACAFLLLLDWHGTFFLKTWEKNVNSFFLPVFIFFCPEKERRKRVVVRKEAPQKREETEIL